jgi:tetratricopeptide (TPR) repeat protein
LAKGIGMTQESGFKEIKTKRKAIAIIGNKYHWDYISMLDAFSDIFEFEVCLLETDVVNFIPNINHKTYIYKNMAGQSGQLPGLELRLHDAHAIFIFDHWSIASYQGSRLASEFDLPLFNFFSGVQHDLFRGTKNLEAAKYDICRTTEKFFVTSCYSKEVLLSEGVCESRIESLPYRVDFTKLGIDRSQKFKKYIGLSENTDIVLFEDYLDGESGAANLIRAWRKFLASDHGLFDPHLVISGEGDFSTDLKYLASDLGVAKKIAFIEQDNFEFKYDLYRASTLYIPAINLDRHNVINPHSRLIEAVACGAYPVLSKHPYYQQILPEFNIGVDFEKIDSISSGLNKASARARFSKASLSSPVKYIKRKYYDEWDGYLLSDTVDKTVQFYLDNKPDFKAALNLISGLVSSERYQEAIIEIEDNLMKRFLTKFYRSELWRYKGLCFRAISTLKDASSCLEKSIDANPGNSQSYLMAGKIAVLGRDFEKATKLFSKTIALDNSLGEAYAGLALTSFEAGMIKQAGFYLESAIIRGGNAVEIIPLVNKIVSLTSDADFNSRFLEKIGDLVGEDKKYMTVLGKLHMEHGDLSLGKKYLKRVG